MTTVEKIFETITADLNQENSRIIAVFHKLTVLLFTGVVSLAVLLFLLFFENSVAPSSSRQFPAVHDRL